MLLPSGKRVNSNTPITPGSNFTWGEATKNCRRPIEPLIINNQMLVSAQQVETNIVKTAIELDRIRRLLLNRPLYINSWYRPQHINQSVGGASRSRHLFGDGVDIRSDYFRPIQIYDVIDPKHPGGGLAAYHSFVHIDYRGYYARW